MTAISAPLVDVHAHYLPEALGQVLRRRTEVPRIASAPEQLVDCGSGLAYPLLDGLTDLAGQLAQMDEDGIGIRLLSVPPPGVAGLPGTDSLDVARDVNDELAALPSLTGGRLRGLAVLPLQHPEQAADELRRAAGLGLPGAQLLSNADGRPLDGPECRVLFAAAAECDSTLVIHPTLPIDRAAVDVHGLLTTLGFLFDTTACAARLVLGGVFDRHPDLKLLLPHAGSTIPYLLGRFDYELELMGIDHGLSGRPSEHLRKLYLDCVCESPQALRLAVEVYGADRIAFGSDEPFWSAQRSLAVVTAAGLDADDVEQIRHGPPTGCSTSCSPRRRDEPAARELRRQGPGGVHEAGMRRSLLAVPGELRAAARRQNVGTPRRFRSERSARVVSIAISSRRNSPLAATSSLGEQAALASRAASSRTALLNGAPTTSARVGFGVRSSSACVVMPGRQ